MTDLPNGIYELLHTKELHNQLKAAGLLNRAVWKKLDADELYQELVIPLSRELAAYISGVITGSKSEEWITVLDAALSRPESMRKILNALSPAKIESLQQIIPPAPFVASTIRPDTSLAVSALFTGASRTPTLRSQLSKELLSCDSTDWLVSFIKYSGLFPLLPALREFTQTPAADGGPRLRVATTSYMGATDVKAIEALLKLQNTEVRVSYDTKRTRLHAKAYLFHRKSGFGSAYIGSANVSKAALDEGLEWTVKVSQYETKHLWEHAVSTFESHWEDQTEFTTCAIRDLSTLKQAIAHERGELDGNETTTFFDLSPYGFQKAILQDLEAERTAGKSKHLVISATGTGKTMIAAFDYKNFCKVRAGRPRLLFIAHREEILRQARTAFRQVLRDGNFGELLVGGTKPTNMDHLFCTVQSWNSRKLNQFAANYFEYIVLDEAHHGAAVTYQRLIDHIKPDVLLGLTATPERTDGKDIRSNFGGAFTHEIRLTEAIERALLSPFHYFGIPDLDGLDFSKLSWKRGGYDNVQLRQQLEGNRARAQWVMGQVEKHVADIQQVRGLGFCVSVNHAQFMAKFCCDAGIPAVDLSGVSAKDLRRRVQQELQQQKIRFIFTVDLYNEGVDIPCVDTVLFLRPTESLTLFLQQLGRGLRLHEEKPHLTVLDFIAPQHRNFSFARRFQALSSRPEMRIDRQIDNDMPYVPAGCLLHLEKQAKEHVLRNIKAAAASLRGQQLIGELRRLRKEVQGEISLTQMVDWLHLDSPDLLYKQGLPHALLAQALGNAGKQEFDVPLAKGFRRLALMDDTNFIADAKLLLVDGACESQLTKAMLNSLLWTNNRPEDGELDQAQRYLGSRAGLKHDLQELLDWLLVNKVPLPKIQFEAATGPLTLHASYTRDQILLALGLGSFVKPKSSREGVLHVSERKLDIFFADINKSEADFSPTTMYHDYAITDRIFHWQTQSQTRDDSPVGLRYINHEERGYQPMLFIRDRKKCANGLTAPYLFAGPLTYREHSGSKPISIKWKLKHALPAKAMIWASRAR